DNEHSEFVFTHEFGHSFADLADEYYDSSTAYNELHKSTVEPYRPNITNLVNFDAKWKNMIDKKTPSPTPNDPKYKGVVGLFEGGGYIAKGMYRPYFDCSMNKIVLYNFCPVCQKAIVDMLGQYAK
ncbi:MAG TPA: peptidase M64, partial [Bacteroidales bacterium]|nr:peptidase M64 [Bacteroidales bacterium]